MVQLCLPNKYRVRLLKNELIKYTSSVVQFILLCYFWMYYHKKQIQEASLRFCMRFCSLKFKLFKCIWHTYPPSAVDLKLNNHCQIRSFHKIGNSEAIKRTLFNTLTICAAIAEADVNNRIVFQMYQKKHSQMVYKSHRSNFQLPSPKIHL